MKTMHTVQGTIDNATNITEAISMLTSKYKGCTKLSIERYVVSEYNDIPHYGYGFTLEYKEEELC